MPPRLLEPLIKFHDEGILIGRLLLAYGEIENAMCSCVAMARDDMDMVVKALYRPRGESQRIDIADALGRGAYRPLKLETHFAEAIAGIRRCVKVRNQFAHCNWHDDNTGKLCFVDMQEIAEQNSIITNLSGLTFHYVDMPLLKQHEAFFHYVGNLFLFLNFEGRKRAGKLPSHVFQVPKKVQPPPPYIP